MGKKKTWKKGLYRPIYNGIICLIKASKNKQTKRYVIRTVRNSEYFQVKNNNIKTKKKYFGNFLNFSQSTIFNLDSGTKM